MTHGHGAQRDQPHPRGGDHEQKLAALRTRLLAQVRAIRTGEDWAAWLRLAAQLRGQRFLNVLLIAAQRPGATLVATYEQWQAAGRQVGRGERGIQVIAAAGDQPRGLGGSGDGGVTAGAAVRDNKVPHQTRPRLGYLWDVSQTSGPPVAGQPRPRGGGPPPGAAWDALRWLARREGFAVEREACGRGDAVTLWAGRRIRVRPGLDAAGAVAALAHELGHVLLHRPAVPVAGASTAGCRGAQGVEAGSVAFIVCRRLGAEAGFRFPPVASWAGSDQRAEPEAAMLTAGERIVAAAERICGQFDIALPAPFGWPGGRAQILAAAPSAQGALAPEREAAVAAPAAAVLAAEVRVEASGWAGQVLADAERFFTGHLETSWVPGYLRSRGFGDRAAQQWRIGCAPCGWKVLTDHLRSLGHQDAAIVAAGLARRSARGALFDHFRDRAMLAIRDERGAVAGFTGRARPNADPAVPKYLNSPQTVVFSKGELLFGLPEARGMLAGGAVPVICEGPFDAIAVTTAGGGRYAGVAACGTALTEAQVAALGRFADLRETGVLVALDGDRAGRQAAVKAYGLLRAVTAKAAAVVLPSGRDPADILRTEGPAALAATLRERAQPLATLVVDARLEEWGHRLDDAAGPLFAMRDVAALIASTLPADTAHRITEITRGRRLETLNDNLRPRVNPELPEIAGLLPPDAVSQMVRLTERLDVEDYSDVLAEVANALITKPGVPKGTAHVAANNPRRRQPPAGGANPAQRTATSFPGLLRPATAVSAASRDPPVRPLARGAPARRLRGR